jgi:hypothetical protein
MLFAFQFSCKISVVDVTLFVTVMRFPYEIYDLSPYEMS